MSFHEVNFPRCKLPFLREEKDIQKRTQCTKGRDWVKCDDSQFNEEYKKWFTVIPLNKFDIRVEDIRVKLNPLCRLVIIKVRSTRFTTCLNDCRDRYKPFKYFVTLPREVRTETLKVKLTQHGEIVVCAPFKHPQKHLTWQPQDKQTLKSQFMYAYEIGDKISWTELPIITYSRLPRTKRCGTNIATFDKEVLRSSDSEDTDTTVGTSEDESYESEWTTTDDDMDENKLFIDRRRRYLKCRKTKIFIEKYVDLLKKIFYPSEVEVKIVPLDKTRMTRINKYLENGQLVCHVKLHDFLTEDVNVYLDVVNGETVLIIEGKKYHKRRLINVRRVVPLPWIFNVDKMMHEVLPNGLLTMTLPIRSIEKVNFSDLFETLKRFERNDLEKVFKSKYYKW